MSRAGRSFPALPELSAGFRERCLAGGRCHPGAWTDRLPAGRYDELIPSGRSRAITGRAGPTACRRG